MFYEVLAYLVLFLCVLAVGYIGGLLHAWGLRRIAVDLDYRVSDLEVRVNREVKIRAAEAGNKAKAEDRRLEEWAAEQQAASSTSAKSSFPSLMDWRNLKMKSG
jgi:hypothetical protein